MFHLLQQLVTQLCAYRMYLWVSCDSFSLKTVIISLSSVNRLNYGGSNSTSATVLFYLAQEYVPRCSGALVVRSFIFACDQCVQVHLSDTHAQILNVTRQLTGYIFCITGNNCPLKLIIIIWSCHIPCILIHISQDSFECGWYSFENCVELCNNKLIFFWILKFPRHWRFVVGLLGYKAFWTCR
jgi:hypothetical protein